MENRRCGERCSNTSYIYHEERNHQGRDNRILFPLRLETAGDGNAGNLPRQKTSRA